MEKGVFSGADQAIRDKFCHLMLSLHLDEPDWDRIPLMKSQRPRPDFLGFPLRG